MHPVVCRIACFLLFPPCPSHVSPTFDACCASDLVALRGATAWGHDRNRRHRPGWPCPLILRRSRPGASQSPAPQPSPSTRPKPCVQRPPPGAQALSTSIVATQARGGGGRMPRREAAIRVWARECMGLPSGCCVRLRIRARSSRYPRCVAIKIASSLMIVALPGVGAVHRGVRRGPLALPAGRRAPPAR
jgi:hypothetical protein